MVNNNIIEGTYNLTGIISGDIIEEPVKWLATFNNEMTGYFIVTILALLGIILFVTMKNQEFEDTRAGVYAGLITTIIGLMLFIVRVTNDPTQIYKLITWSQFLPFLVITAIMILLDKINRRY